MLAANPRTAPHPAARRRCGRLAARDQRACRRANAAQKATSSSAGSRSERRASSRSETAWPRSCPSSRRASSCATSRAASCSTTRERCSCLRKPLDGAAATGKAHTPGRASGRSIFAIFDRNLIIHALESIHDRLRKGERAPVANFVTTAPAGQLVRVQLAPVLGAVRTRRRPGAIDGIAGFVLLLDNITRRIESGQSPRPPAADAHAGHARVARAACGPRSRPSRRFPDMDDATRRTGSSASSARKRSTLSAQLDQPVARLRRFAAHRVAARGHARRRPDRGRAPAHRAPAAAADQARERRRVDLAQRRQLLADAGDHATSSRRLADEFGIREIRFALADAGTLAHLDLIWTGAPLGSETTMAWQTDSMELGGEACPLTLKQIIERHDAEIWYQIDKPVAARILPHRDPEDAARGNRRGARRPPPRAGPSSTTSTSSTSRGRRPSSTTGRSRR